MSAGRLAELQGAQEVSAAAGLCRHHTEEMEALLPPQVPGGRGATGSMEGVQGEEALLSDVWGRDATSGSGEGIRGSPQVSGRKV